MPFSPEQLILRRVSELDDPGVLGTFSCGSESLEDFLHEQAVTYDQYGITSTTVVFHVDNPNLPIGYFSLSADSLRLKDSEKFDLGLPFEAEIASFPAVKITRLATSSAVQSQGLGKVMIEMIEGLVFAHSIATRLLVVDADNNARTLKFYAQRRFHESLHNADQAKNAGGGKMPERQTISMWRDIYAEA